MLLAVILGVVLARAAFGWPAGGAVVCNAPCDQTVTSVLADGAGGVYLAWEDDRSCSNKFAYIQHLDSQGSVVAGWPLNGRPVSTSVVGQVLPRLVADGSGGAIAVWQDYRSGVTVFAQRFQSDGTALWNPAGVAVCDSAGQWATSSLADGAGGVFVVWDDTRRGLHAGPAHDALYDFFAQHIDGNGVRVWGAYAAPITREVQIYGGATVIGSSAAGTLFVVTQQGIRVQRLDASGQDLLGVSGASPAGMTVHELCSDGAGGFISLYTRGIAAGVVGLYAARADGAGNVLWGGGDSKLVATLPSDAHSMSVVSDGEGGAYAGWYDTQSGGDEDVHVQRVSGSGDIASGWPANGVDVTPIAGSQTNPSIAADGAHGVLITWQDGRDAGSGFDVYAQHVTANGTIASGWPSAGLRLEHAAGDQTRPLISADGTGAAFVAWTDMSGDGDVYATRVSAGGTLGVGGVLFTGFAIAAVYPNPSPGGAMRVSLTLPSAAPAHVSLIDVQGRLVARQEVRVSSAGSTTVSLAARSHLAPGIYRVRLDQLGRTASRVVAVVR
jgi:hypothetical protein